MRLRDSDDTLGTVTITGLSNDLTNFNGGSYTASTGTWTGTAAQFDALTFNAGEDGVQHLTITASDDRGGGRQHQRELHADRQPGGGRPGGRRHDFGDGEPGRRGDAGR